MNLLIVDDEKSVRQGLLETVPWQNIGITGVTAARNGPDALREMQKKPVDIVITDIRMPGMDGLELAFQIRQNWPGCHIILLSAYSEFEYAQKAISIGVDTYLIKPVDIDNLLSVVKNICLNRNDHQVSSDKESIIPSISSLPENMRSHNMQALSVRLHVNSDEYCRFPDIIENTNRAMEKVLQSRFQTYKYDINKNDVQSFILLQDGHTASSEIAELSVLTDRIASTVDSSTLSITSAISDIYPVTESRTARLQSLKLLQYSFFLGSNIIITPDCLCNKKYGHPAPIADDITLLKKVLSTKNISAILDTLHRILREYRFCSTDDIQQIRENCGEIMNLLISIMSSESASRYVYITSKNYLHTADTLEDLITLIESAYCAILEQPDKSHAGRNYLVESLKEYTQNNYADNDTSITKAAAYLDRNPNYLSHLFVQTEKCTYTEYLNKIRVEKAKELLDRTLLASYEIADMVGFSNYRYFSQVFKNLTGYTPHQWRNRN